MSKSNLTGYSVVILCIWVGIVFWFDLVARLFRTDLWDEAQIRWLFQHAALGCLAPTHADRWLVVGFSYASHRKYTCGTRSLDLDLPTGGSDLLHSGPVCEYGFLGRGVRVDRHWILYGTEQSLLLYLRRPVSYADGGCHWIYRDLLLFVGHRLSGNHRMAGSRRGRVCDGVHGVVRCSGFRGGRYACVCKR